ncbi:MAG: 30S ribosomal protein S13 [Elusimicrobia bacterium]|nr:30S ribosomal protein S13 [Elusimicrobiota bacterium]
MARVSGVDLPKNKRIDVALTYLYGVGKSRAKEVMAKLSGVVKPDVRVKDLTEQQIGLIQNLLTKEYKIEGDLRRETQAHMSRLTEIGSYRGHRHRRSLPARGQRTRTNARTRRGRRKTVGVGKAASPTGKA